MSMLSIVRNASSGSEFIHDSARSRWREETREQQPDKIAAINVNDKAVTFAFLINKGVKHRFINSYKVEIPKRPPAPG